MLTDNHYITGKIRGLNRYTKEEHKEFFPDQHQFYREKLIDSFKHNQENYFKGICTSSDGHVGKENFDWMVKFHGGDHESLSFANREILYVVNGLANTSKLPFEVSKRFEIGSNCMIENYDTSEAVKKYIKDNNIQDAIILCSAASLSNFIIYEGFKENQNNTFLDIGSCLNPLLDLEGWRYTRGYLTGYWLNSGSPFQRQVDKWS